MTPAVRHYALVTATYWAFTMTDGALRMLVLLHFHALGYDPIALAFLFILYEICGVITNLLGGWLAARAGLRRTLLGGIGIQIAALAMLALLGSGWTRALSVAYVMAAQALSGVAKDLTKVSAKSSLKVLVPAEKDAALFHWVALLTGSKNALKGVGFFLGGLLLEGLGFRGALWVMAAGLGLVLLGGAMGLPGDLGRSKAKARFRQLLSPNRGINILSAARLFLFGARDTWFVVGVPLFLAVELGWDDTQVGAFLAAWVIGYGLVQAAAPRLIARATDGRSPGRGAAQVLAFILTAVTVAMPVAIVAGAEPGPTILVGLGLFGVVFALNSSVHSYLVLAYADGDKLAMQVGFYYMANAIGRLLGTLVSGVLAARAGVTGCLWVAAGAAAVTGFISLALPVVQRNLLVAGAAADGD
jgi:predicted MFS family arabinose efflux permease